MNLPKSQGNSVILVVIDHFSQSIRLIPLPALPSELGLAKVLFNQVFRYFGLPEDIASDHGPQFVSQVWHKLMDNLGVSPSLTSGYHPQANGQVEQLNLEEGRFQRTYCTNHQIDWVRFLHWAEYAQNSVQQQK